MPTGLDYYVLDRLDRTDLKLKRLCRAVKHRNTIDKLCYLFVGVELLMQVALIYENRKKIEALEKVIADNKAETESEKGD